MMQGKLKMLPLHIQSFYTNQTSDIYPECGHGEQEGRPEIDSGFSLVHQTNDYEMYPSLNITKKVNK